MLPTYHLLREPETAIDYRFCQETFDAGRYCDIPSFEFAPKGLENLSESWWLKIPTPLKHMRKSNWESSPRMKITFLKPPPVVKFPFPIFGVNMKFNMEPERKSLEKEIPNLETLIFRFHVIFRGSSQNGNLPQFCGVKIQKQIFELPPPSCVFEFFSASRKHFLEGFLGGDVWKNTR